MRPGRLHAVSDAPISADLFARAQRVIPGGVNSPVRAFRAVGGTPRFMVSGSRRLPHRRRRPHLRRPGLVLGTDDPRARASRRWSARCSRRRRPGCRSARRRSGEIELAEEIIARVNAASPAGRSRAARAGAARQLRYRGDDVGDPAGARRHRAAPGGEVRRLLPRPRRRAARRGGLGRRDVRAAGHAGRHRRADGGDDRAALQRPRRGATRASPSSVPTSPA